MKQQRQKVSVTLHRAIRHSGLSRYAIAKKTGISDSSLSRFMAGKQGLSLAAVDGLAKLFGLQLTALGDPIRLTQKQRRAIEALAPRLLSSTRRRIEG